MTTQEKITARALELFNQKGIESVGMRALAADLGMSLGNITYYYPTKEALIVALGEQLTALNSGVMAAVAGMTMEDFFGMIRQHFRNQTQYRCLLLGMVQVMDRYTALAERYKTVEATRRAVTWQILLALAGSGQLNLADGPTAEYLQNILVFAGRFWISEAAISHSQMQSGAQIDLYVSMIAWILLPYATQKSCGLLESVAKGQEG